MPWCRPDGGNGRGFPVVLVWWNWCNYGTDVASFMPYCRNRKVASPPAPTFGHLFTPHGCSAHGVISFHQMARYTVKVNPSFFLFCNQLSAEGRALLAGRPPVKWYFVKHRQQRNESNGERYQQFTVNKTKITGKNWPIWSQPDGSGDRWAPPFSKIPSLLDLGRSSAASCCHAFVEPGWRTVVHWTTSLLVFHWLRNRYFDRWKTRWDQYHFQLNKLQWIEQW